MTPTPTSQDNTDELLDPDYIKIAIIFQKYGKQCATRGTGYFEHLEADNKPIKEVFALFQQARTEAAREARKKLLNKLERTYTPINKPIPQSPMELTDEAKLYNRFVEDLRKFIHIERRRIAYLEQLSTPLKSDNLNK